MMLADIHFEFWHWLIFISFVIAALAVDLGIFHRKAHAVKIREAIAWTAIWATLAFLFAAFLFFRGGKKEAVEFVTGYIIEYSLSMDNVFVIALIFSYFRVPLQYQHRVLFWGILGAFVMRGIMIGAGTALVYKFHWLLYVMGAFLVISGFKMAFHGEESAHPERNPVLRLARKFLPITPDYHGQRFMIRLPVADAKNSEGGVPVTALAFTPLALVLLAVETADLIFAVDSIPAIFSVTLNPFIVFTSNVFAILGLRSLYFVLAGAIAYFRYLRIGLSLVLVFVGLKMLLPLAAQLWPAFERIKITTEISLLVVAFIIIASILASVIRARFVKGDE